MYNNKLGIAVNLSIANKDIAVQTFTIWAILLLCAPVILFFSTIQIDGEFSGFQLLLRAYWGPAVIVEVITLFMALRLGWEPVKQFRNLRLYERILIIMWIMSLVIGSTFFSTISTVANISTFLWILHLGFFGAIYFLVGHWNLCNQAKLRRLSMLIIPLAAAIIGSLMVIYTFIIGHDADFDWLRQMPGPAHIRHFGYILLFGAAISVGAIASHINTKVHLILLVINLAIIIWSGSRGAFIALIIGCIVGFLAFKAIRSMDVIKPIISALLIAILASQIVPTPPSNSYDIFSRFSKNIEEGGDVTSSRTILWTEAAELISEKPFFGHGGDQFKYVAKSAYFAARHPHNMILQMLFEWGLVGGLSFLYLLSTLIWTMVKQVIVQKGEPAFYITIASIMALSLIDGIIFYSLPIAMFAFVFAMILNAQNIDNDQFIQGSRIKG